MEKLKRKLEKAEQCGDEDRASRLRIKLSEFEPPPRDNNAADADAEVAPVDVDFDAVTVDVTASRIAKARRRLERAVRDGADADTIELCKAKLLRLGASAASADASAAPDEQEMERSFQAEHGGEGGGDDHDHSRELKKEKMKKKNKRIETEEEKEEGDTEDKKQADVIKSTNDSVTKSSSAINSGDKEDEIDRSNMVLAKNGKWYPKPTTPVGNTSLLLFYAYVQPAWNHRERNDAINFTHDVLQRNGCGGRLRVAYEGFNGTLSGPPEGIRAFCKSLREYDPKNFGEVDFKVVDGLADNKAFRGLKVWAVEELVTYGLKKGAAEDEAPLVKGGIHVKPSEWTERSARADTVMIDVRNANETAIGRFKPPTGGAILLDPRMRRSTEFPQWIDEHADEIRGKHVMMYCTAGIRCERASALLASKGLAQDIVQLDGGIHRYLDAYPDDGGIWAGKNYTFDKRFSHGAKNQADVVGVCSSCSKPWERYQAQAKCSQCRMETLLCRDCERGGKAKNKNNLLCWLCAEIEAQPAASASSAARAKARSFAKTGGGRDGEGEGSKYADFEDEKDERPRQREIKPAWMTN
jgi:predicted sulfurtransferase